MPCCDYCGRPNAIRFRIPNLPGLPGVALDVYACHQGEAEKLFDMPKAERETIIARARNRAKWEQHQKSLLLLA